MVLEAVAKRYIPLPMTLVVRSDVVDEFRRGTIEISAGACVAATRLSMHLYSKISKHTHVRREHM